MLVLGDAHADERPNRDALMAAYEATDAGAALQLGDLMYYELPRPTWFVAGNNEDFDVIDSLRTGDGAAATGNAHLLASAATRQHGLRVAGLSGNYAPTQFDKSRPQLAGERRRHFVQDDVERAKALEDIDVLLVHEAPHGLDVDEEYRVGCSHVDAILRALEPDLCLVGHHHQYTECTVAGTRVVSLAPVWEHYYTLDPDSLALERHLTPSP